MIVYCFLVGPLWRSQPRLILLCTTSEKSVIAPCVRYCFFPSSVRPGHPELCLIFYLFGCGCVPWEIVSVFFLASSSQVLLQRQSSNSKHYLEQHSPPSPTTIPYHKQDAAPQPDHRPHDCHPCGSHTSSKAGTRWCKSIFHGCIFPNSLTHIFILKRFSSAPVPMQQATALTTSTLWTPAPT